MPKRQPTKKKEPNELRDTYSAGICAYIQHDWNAAIKHFTAVLGIDAKHQGALHHRGHAYIKLKKHTDGWTDLDQVTDPSFKKQRIRRRK